MTHAPSERSRPPLWLWFVILAAAVVIVALLEAGFRHARIAAGRAETSHGQSAHYESGDVGLVSHPFPASSGFSE